MKTIQAGQTITGRSVCDSECIFSATVDARKGGFATIKFQGNTKRVKIHAMDDCEFVFPCGRYSMAPVLKAN
jgi:hypothetical protein